MSPSYFACTFCDVVFSDYNNRVFHIDLEGDEADYTMRYDICRDCLQEVMYNKLDEKEFQEYLSFEDELDSTITITDTTSQHRLKVLIDMRTSLRHRLIEKAKEVFLYWKSFDTKDSDKEDEDDKEFDKAYPATQVSPRKRKAEDPPPPAAETQPRNASADSKENSA